MEGRDGVVPVLLSHLSLGFLGLGFLHASAGVASAWACGVDVVTSSFFSLDVDSRAS